ncbi:Crp/Fnr family transcriptional regulator [Ectothiorhodospiraceae bacterium WFHF3C12]|nr:Crp/Fnr family transcriptional regulator [Ectothiorhodospiraceae bacterium WFHF3C12]
MNELRAALTAVPYFQALDDADIDGIAEHIELRDLEADSVVLLQGEPCAGLGLVVKGRVRVVRTSLEGREQVLRILGPGRTFNDVAAVDGGANPGTVVATVPATVGLFPRHRLMALLERRPVVARAMLDLLAHRLRSVVDLVEDTSLHSVVSRVARLILRCATDDQQLVEGAPEACQRITQQDIAAMTGSVREVVQRALKFLEQEGAIKLGRAEVIVTDVAVLQAYAEA